MRVGLVDYGAGNLQSVRNALRSLEVESTVVSSAAGFEGVDAVVFPGVGAFGDSMLELTKRGLGPALGSWIHAGRPFLGICVGYQVLFETSDESPGAAGLGIFRGRVVRMAPAGGLKVPHMGWNEVRFRDPADPLWRGLGAAAHFYFVHSYYPAPADESLLAAITDYGGDFASAIRWPGGAAVQFHPEKSQEAGLRLLTNFADFAAQSLSIPA